MQVRYTIDQLNFYNWENSCTVHLLLIANEYNVQCLQYKIAAFIASELTEENVFQMIDIYEQFAVTALKYPILNFILCHYKQLADRPELEKLSKEWQQLIQYYWQK